MKPLKPYLTYQEQINLLRERGMQISNEDYAIRYLHNYNYFHLNPYFKILLDTNDKFKPTTNFEDVTSMLHLDIRFKEVLWLYLQRIELKFKTSIAHSLAKSHTSYAFYSPQIYQSSNYYHDELRILETIKKRDSKREVIFHHENNYGGLYPIWVIVDLFSFSQVSLFYKNLKQKYQRLISSENYPGLGNEHLESWIHAAVNFRNVIAHLDHINERTFNISTISVDFFQRNNIESETVFKQILLISRLLDEEGFSMLLNTIKFAVENLNNDLSCYGFPNNWNTILTDFRKEKLF